MPKQLHRARQAFTVKAFLSGEADLPEKVELVNGEIGPYSDAAKLSLLANWGADEIIRLTGPQIWHDALAAWGKTR
ncbi:MAG: hypothetical protein ABL901_08935 [Hyphomicrobiaceae bacterium]